MRANIGFNATAVAAAAASTVDSVTKGGGSAHSAWHSPVNYLFGALAALFGLIALVILILACSYRKPSGFLESRADLADDRSSKPEEPEQKPAPAHYEEGVVVIMAGEEKPSYLAIPICNRGSSFQDTSSNSSTTSITSSVIDYGRSGSRDDCGVDGKKEMKRCDRSLVVE